MAILDNYNIRYNTSLGVIEINTGGETWTPLSTSSFVNTGTFTNTGAMNENGKLTVTANGTGTSASLDGGQIVIRGLSDTNRQLNLGFDTTFAFGWIQAGIYGFAYEPLLLNPAGSQVGIGATTTINASALLQVTSTTQGILFPRMTTTQRDAIATPAEGLVIYDTTQHKLCVRVAAAWETVTSA